MTQLKKQVPQQESWMIPKCLTGPRCSLVVQDVRHKTEISQVWIWMRIIFSCQVKASWRKPLSKIFIFFLYKIILVTILSNFIIISPLVQVPICRNNHIFRFLWVLHRKKYKKCSHLCPILKLCCWITFSQISHHTPLDRQWKYL